VPRGAGVRVGLGTRVGLVSTGSGSEPLGRVPVGRGELVGGGTRTAVAVALGPGVRVGNGWTVTIRTARSVVGLGAGVRSGARVGSEPPSLTATTALAGTGDCVGGPATAGGAQAVQSDSRAAARQPIGRLGVRVLYSGRFRKR